MISYNDIQALIAEIDRVLPDRSERVETPTEDNGVEENAQQAVLEKVRWYLLDLRNQIEIEPGGSLLGQGGQQETAMAIASAVMSQLNLHRQDWLQPLHGEVEELRRQRESLLAEIRTLEGRHLQLMSDFLQILLGRCSKALQQELSLALEKFETQLWQLQTPRDEKVAPTPLQHLDRLQKLRSLQQQADVLVLNLDRTLRKVFESLEGDMQSYHQSLALGIAEMHELGQQGKTVLAAYLQRLNPELTGQSLATEVTEESETIDPEEMSVADTGDIEASPVASMAMFPFAGMEIPPAPSDRESSPGWELEEEGEAESVDALFEVNIEERDEASEGLEAWEAWDEHLFHSDELMNADDEEAIPIVLTLKEAELEAEEEVSVDEPPIRDLFSGLADPAIAAEEVIAEEVIAEEVIAEEVIAEEVIAEEVIAEEVIAEEVIAEEVIAEEVVAEEVIAEEVIAEEVIAEEVVPEEVVSLDSPPPTIEIELFGEPTETEEEIVPVVIEEDIPSEETPPISETDSQTLDEIVGETIASLTELLEEKSEQVEEEEEIDDDEVISVAAGETLLATDEVKPQPQADLETLLDSGQLRTLTEDLANFEGNAPVSEVEISPADIEETLTEEEIEPPLEIQEAIATKEETVPTEFSPTEETPASADRKPEIHLDSPEIDAAMEVDDSFEEAFEEEIISEEDEDWMLPETAIAAVTEVPAQDAIAIPPSAILSSLADLDWQGVQDRQPTTSNQQQPTSQPPPKRGSATNNQLEIVVDDDFELPPPKQVLAGAGTSRNSVPVMRSPKPTPTFSTREDLWDNSETTVPSRDARNFSQNSKEVDNSDRAVTEIMTDPWNEAPEPSEKKRKQT